MTCQYAIPYLADELPVHRLRISGAAELVTVPTTNNDDPAREAYEFEVSMTGYYTDPIDDPNQRGNRALRAAMTHTNTQTCFAPTAKPLFRSILGSDRLHIGNSRFFIEGGYTFAFGPTENGSCIELSHMGFNATNRTSSTSLQPPQPAADSARRRNVHKKGDASRTAASSSSAPVTPQNNKSVVRNHGSSVASASATPYSGSSVRATPSTSNTSGGHSIAPEYQLDDFLDIEDFDMSIVQETVSPSQFRKGKRVADGPPDIEDGEPVGPRPKRQRKLTAKAAALIIDEAEEDGFEELDVDEDKD
jgi:hypothetical protein